MHNPSSSTHCQICGAALDSRRLAGLCPSCTWRSLEEVDSSDLAQASALPDSMLRIPNHVVLEEIARGGMGIVYRARQVEPERIVALKMLLPQQLGSPALKERFRQEIRAIASLEHPAILPVYQVGEQDGFPFFTMKLAAGGTLATRLPEYHGCPRAAAEVLATLADAVHFAHQRGVLHRDLKPGNILFDEVGRPYVSDFGLAKFTQLDEGTPALTQSLHLIGTPQFLPPEAAAGLGHAATTAGDIYSLGGILYEMLTGQPPFVAETLPALLKMVVEREPVRPSKRAPGLPRDLEVICLKCLAKDPARRYGSARELAEDLRLWLQGRPIQARRASGVERLWRWARRNPVSAGLAASLIVALLIGALALRQSNGRLVRALTDSRASLRGSLLAQARFQRTTRRAGQRLQTLELVRRAVAEGPDLTTRSAAAADLRTEVAGAVALPDLEVQSRWPVFVPHYEARLDFTRTLDRYVTAVPEGGFTVFATADRREWRHFPGATNNPALQVSLSPQGGWVAAVFQDGHAEVRSLVSNVPPRSWPGELIARTVVEFSPDDRAALVSVRKRGLLWCDLRSGREDVILPQSIRPHLFEMESSGERLLVASGKDCLLIHLPDKTMLWSRVLVHRPTALAWAPDGRQVAVAYDGRKDEPPGKTEVGLWLLEAATGVQSAQFNAHELTIESVGFEPKSGSVVSVGWDGRMVWQGRQDLDWIADGATLAWRSDPTGDRVGYAPSREELAVARVIPATAFHEWNKSSPPDEEVYAQALSPDGSILATASGSGIHLWDTAAGAEMSQREPPAKRFWTTLFFHPDGRSLLYSAANFGVMQADLVSGVTSNGRRRIELAEPKRISPGLPYVLQEFAPDGKSLVVGEIQQQTRNDRISPTFWLWPEADPSKARKLAEGFPMTGYRLVAGGQWGITTDNLLPDVWLWNPQTARRVRSLRIRLGVMTQNSADRRWMITSTRQEYILWDTGSWQALARWPARADQRTGSEGAFSRDGRLFATFDAAGRIDLIALPEGRRLLTLPPPIPMRFQSVAFSTNADRLFLLRGNGRVYEWNLRELRQELAALKLDW